MASELTCVCGIVVSSSEELDVYGLCFDCSARAPEQGCDCPECEEARERVYVGATVVRLMPRRGGRSSRRGRSLAA